MNNKLINDPGACRLPDLLITLKEINKHYH